MKLNPQFGNPNSLPAGTFEASVESVTGLDQLAPPFVERMYTTSASVPFQLDHATCSVDPSSARAGKLSSRKVAPGSGLGMSLIGAIGLVVNVAPPLVETANATESVLPLKVSNVKYTVPVLLTTTVEPWSLVKTLEIRCGADQVRPPSVVLEMTIAELPPLNRVQVT